MATAATAPQRRPASSATPRPSRSRRAGVPSCSAHAPLRRSRSVCTVRQSVGYCSRLPGVLAALAVLAPQQAAGRSKAACARLALLPQRRGDAGWAREDAGWALSWPAARVAPLGSALPATVQEAGKGQRCVRCCSADDGARAGGAAPLRGAGAGAARRGQVHAHPLPGQALHAPGAV